MRHLNCEKQPVEYFDSYGFKPDHDDKILGVKTRFREFIDKHNMNRQPPRFNRYDLQSYGTDVCGEYCAWFIKNGLPFGLDGRVNPPWRSVMNYRNSHNRDAYIKNLVGIRKKRQQKGGMISRPRLHVEFFKHVNGLSNMILHTSTKDDRWDHENNNDEYNVIRNIVSNNPNLIHQ
jgi:hypothetical protein